MALICYLLGLSGTFAGMALVQLDYRWKRALCAILGPGTYFLILFSFGWLSVIGYDVWRNFRGTGRLYADSKRQRWQQFGYFSLYAGLMPSLMVALSLVADGWPDAVPVWLQPGFARMVAVESCFLKSGSCESNLSWMA